MGWRELTFLRNREGGGNSLKTVGLAVGPPHSPTWEPLPPPTPSHPTPGCPLPSGTCPCRFTPPGDRLSSSLNYTWLWTGPSWPFWRPPPSFQQPLRWHEGDRVACPVLSSRGYAFQRATSRRQQWCLTPKVWKRRGVLQLHLSCRSQGKGHPRYSEVSPDSAQLPEQAGLGRWPAGLTGARPPGCPLAPGQIQTLMHSTHTHKHTAHTHMHSTHM